MRYQCSVQNVYFSTDTSKSIPLFLFYQVQRIWFDAECLNYLDLSIVQGDRYVSSYIFLCAEIENNSGKAREYFKVQYQKLMWKIRQGTGIDLKTAGSSW